MIEKGTFLKERTKGKNGFGEPGLKKGGRPKAGSDLMLREGVQEGKVGVGEHHERLNKQMEKEWETMQRFQRGKQVQILI